MIEDSRTEETREGHEFSRAIRSLAPMRFSA
jgi:hypothetical protein